MDKVLHFLNKFSIAELEKLAGQTIVRAVKYAYETDSERELAKLVLDRYGNNIFSNPDVRLRFIQLLTKEQAELACNKIKLKINPSQDPYTLLEERFGNQFTYKKSLEFILIFDLPNEFAPLEERDTRLEKEVIHAQYGEQLKSKGVLHPYQIRVKDSIRRKLNLGTKRLIAQMPTGAGKTVTALEVISDYVRGPDFTGFAVWIVDSNELADQAFNSFLDLWKLRGDRPINAYRYFKDFTPDFNQSMPGVVFTSFTKTWAAIDSKKEYEKSNFYELCKRSSLVIVDEAHTSVADTYSATIEKLVYYDALLIGLSATPGRNSDFETRELRLKYGDELVSITDANGKSIDDEILYLQKESYLASIKFEDFDGATVIDTDVKVICKNLAENSERNEKIINQIQKAIDLDQSTIVFACTVDHVIALMALCRSRNINADFIIGEVPQFKRVRILERFRSKDLKVIINHEMLSTGIDLPNVDKLIITRPVGSPILYSQILGRALRGPKNGGNESNFVVNINDNLKNFPSASYIFNSFKNNFI